MLNFQSIAIAISIISMVSYHVFKMHLICQLWEDILSCFVHSITVNFLFFGVILMYLCAFYQECKFIYLAVSLSVTQSSSYLRSRITYHCFYCQGLAQGMIYRRYPIFVNRIEFVLYYLIIIQTLNKESAEILVVGNVKSCFLVLPF